MYSWMTQRGRAKDSDLVWTKAYGSFHVAILKKGLRPEVSALLAERQWAMSRMVLLMALCN